MKPAHLDELINIILSIILEIQYHETIFMKIYLYLEGYRHAPE